MRLHGCCRNATRPFTLLREAVASVGERWSSGSSGRLRSTASAARWRWGPSSRARCWRCCCCTPTSRSAPSGWRWRCGARRRRPTRRGRCRSTSRGCARRSATPRRSRPRRRATGCGCVPASSTPSALSVAWRPGGARWRRAGPSGRRAAARRARVVARAAAGGAGVRAVRAGGDRAAWRSSGWRRWRRAWRPISPRGRHAALIGELQGLLAEHPTRERFAAELMLALYRSGRQAEALAVYRDARRVLVEQVGVEPGPELQRLQQAVLATTRRSSCRLPAAGARATGGRGGARARRSRGPRLRRGAALPRPPNRTIGRAREVGAVARAATGGLVRLPTLTGPGGVGKTRLAVEAARTVEADFADGAGSCRSLRCPRARTSRGRSWARWRSCRSRASRRRTRSSAFWPSSICCWSSTTASTCPTPHR